MTRSPELDPRQRLCWENYINPSSETFSDAKASAIKAGYGPAYAAEIKLTSWFKGRERRLRMRDKGEEVLEEMLNMPVLVTTYTGLGHDKTPVVVTEPALVRIKQDTAKFAVERLGKDEWSGRQEHSGPEGGPIVTQEHKENGNNALDKFIGKLFGGLEDDPGVE